MIEKLPTPSREQRLAAKLRENLKRRKEQVKARTAVPAAAGHHGAPEAPSTPGDDSES